MKQSGEEAATDLKITAGQQTHLRMTHVWGDEEGSAARQERTERSGSVVFFGPDGSTCRRNILLHGTIPLWTFSTKHQQKWNGTAPFHLTPKPNTTLVRILNYRSHTTALARSSTKRTTPVSRMTLPWRRWTPVPTRSCISITPSRHMMLSLRRGWRRSPALRSNF
jgi:hypothetical protein